MIPRGIRNKNPGNIERSNRFTWIGELDLPLEDPHRDERFAVFDDVQYGLRAMMKLLINYNQKHDIKTLRQAINRWAPKNENNTDKYAKTVARWADINPDDEWDFTQLMFLVPVVKAMVRYENGAPAQQQIEDGAHEFQWYSNMTYQNAYVLAVKGRITSHTMNKVPMKKAEPEPELTFWQTIINLLRGKKNG